VIDDKICEEIRITVIATGFGNPVEQSLPKAATAVKDKGGSPISISLRDGLRVGPKEVLREPHRDPLRDGFRETFREGGRENNRDIPTFLLKTKTKERFDELKLVENPDFSMEDEDRFDIPTFLRKQAD